MRFYTIMSILNRSQQVVRLVPTTRLLESTTHLVHLTFLLCRTSVGLYATMKDTAT